MRYSPNPKVQATIEALLAIGVPPIPVACWQDPRKEWCHRVVKNKDGVKYCPVDKNLNPIPRFTGKNPSYLKRNGSAWICLHGEFQTRLPTEAELKEFFCHPDTGVGTLGGHAGVDWLDFDKKCYDSQEECDRDVERIISENNLQSTWIERTGSGGWRIAVRPTKKPTYTNFATNPSGCHVGEALFEGRFTVLAPSTHPNGNPYRRTGWGTPIEVESLEAIGIYPSKDEIEQAKRNQKREQHKAFNPHYGKPSNPQDNPWDIRNFAYYFEGYHEQGDGWAAAKCPRHNGTSQTSFRVNLDTGEYKLWCGCSTKDVYKSGLALAVAAGYNTPKGKVEFISPDEAWGLYKQAFKQAEQTEKQRQQRLETEAEEAIYQALTTIQEKPWKEVNTDKLRFDELALEPGAIYIIQSAKGTEKTKGVIPVVAEYENVLAWFSRVALGREECEKLGLTWKNELSTFKGKKRGFCSNASFQFSPYILGADGLLLIDECDQVFDHNFGSTCNKDGKRPLILATLEAHINAAISGGGIALFMSADVTQKEVDYIKALAPKGCPIRLIVNHHKPLKGDIYFDISDKPDGQIEKLLADLEAGKPCFVLDDIKNGVRGCKSIAEYIRTIHPEWSHEIVEINSDTSGDPVIIDYLKTINEASKSTRLLCCSPSVVSGISIENRRFVDGVYAFLHGVLTVNNACQGIGRVRGANTTNVWAAEEGLIYEANRATDPREIKAWYQRNYEANCKHILSFGTDYDPLKREWTSPHFELFCKNATYRNLCMSKLRERLRTRLEAEGFNIVLTGSSGSDMVENGLKQAWNHIELSQAHAVDKAKILTEDKLKQLEEKQSKGTLLTPEEKLDVEKTYLLKSFGQELIDATTFEHKSGQTLTGFAAMTLKNERGVYRNQLESFYLLQADLGEAIAKDLADERKQLQHNEGRFPGDLRWRTRQKKAREFLGLPEFLKPEQWWEPKDYAELAQRAKVHPLLIKDVLNLGVEKISGGQIFGEFMQQIGLDLEKQWAETKPGQKRFKRRRLTQESWQYAQMYVSYRNLLKAEKDVVTELQEYVTVASESVLITPPSNSIESQGGGDQKLIPESIDTSRNIELCDSSEVSQGDVTEISQDGANCHTSSIEERCGYPAKAGLTTSACHVTEGATIEEGSYQATEPSPIDELIQAFEFCDTPADFSLVTEGYTPDQVESAIALQDSQPIRQRLREWQECVFRAEENQDQGEVRASAQITLPKAFAIGHRLRGMRGTLAEKIAKVTESFGDWCETTLGPIAMSEVDGGSWTFV